MATRLEPVKKVARMFKRYWANIVTYVRHHLSNAHAEGIKSRIQHIIQQACGFRNRARFKREIMFHLKPVVRPHFHLLATPADLLYVSSYSEIRIPKS
jgi:hypothetical protein